MILNNSIDVTTNGGVTYVGVVAAGGTLDLRNVVGAATVEFDNAVLAEQTVSFFGAGRTLALNDAPAFKGAITGFDTNGSADALLILGVTYKYAGASETETLAFSNGASAFSLTLTGDYHGGTFVAQMLANGQIKITYWWCGAGRRTAPFPISQSDLQNQKGTYKDCSGIVYVLPPRFGAGLSAERISRTRRS